MGWLPCILLLSLAMLKLATIWYLTPTLLVASSILWMTVAGPPWYGLQSINTTMLLSKLYAFFYPYLLLKNVAIPFLLLPWLVFKCLIQFQYLHQMVSTQKYFGIKQGTYINSVYFFSFIAYLFYKYLHTSIYSKEPCLTAPVIIIMIIFV